MSVQKRNQKTNNNILVSLAMKDINEIPERDRESEGK